jgi:hypothetical protein
MAKVRVVMAELEGPEETVLSAIRSFMPETTAPTVSVPAIAAPPVKERKAIEASVLEREHRRPARRVKKVAAAAGDRGTLSGAIRAAVAEGPKTNGEVLRYVMGHGFPDADSGTISTILCQRRKANEMYKSDDDLKWHVAVKETR